MTFREIKYGSKDYASECRLRDEILRRPLGMALSAEDCLGEAEQRHFGLFSDGTLMACVIAVPLSPTEVKLRQMAVAANQQRQGLGRELLRRVEEKLGDEGCARFVLNARRSAQIFYEKLGYAIVGEEFLEVGLPHFKMEKRFLEK